MIKEDQLRKDVMLLEGQENSIKPDEERNPITNNTFESPCSFSLFK